MLLFISSARADVELQWDFNLDEVHGYRLYVGNEPGVYTWSYDLGWTHSTIVSSMLLDPAVYFFAVTAYREDCWNSGVPCNEPGCFPTWGCSRFEGPFSNEVKWVEIVPAVPSPTPVDSRRRFFVVNPTKRETQMNLVTGTPFNPILGLLPKILRRPKMLKAHYRNLAMQELAAARAAGARLPEK